MLFAHKGNEHADDGVAMQRTLRLNQPATNGLTQTIDDSLTTLAY